MRQPWIRGVVCALAAVVVAPAASVRAAAPVDGAEDLRALLDRYCVTCHNERLRTGNLALDRTPLDPIRERADVWEKVLLKLEERAMPPPGRRARPEPAAYDAAARVAGGGRSTGRRRRPPTPAGPAIHRLNRAEYANAVRDLLALEIDAPALLPADDLGFGFDNNADLLNVSPALMERYVSAAHKVSRMAVGDPRAAAGGRDLRALPNPRPGRSRGRRDAVRVARRRLGAPSVPARRRVRVAPAPAARHRRQHLRAAARGADRAADRRRAGSAVPGRRRPRLRARVARGVPRLPGR